MAQTTPTRPTSPHRRPRRGRRSGIAGTGGGRRNTGTGGPGGEARPSPGSSPPGTPDLRRGVDATVTTGPISDALERLQAEHRELSAGSTGTSCAPASTSTSGRRRARSSRRPCGG